MTTNYPIPYHPTWEIKDTSKLNDYILCPRYYFFRNLLGWESSAPRNDKKFGECWHVAMEHLLLNGYGDASVTAAYDKFLACYRQEFSDDTDALYGAKVPARVLPALLEYTKEYPHDLDEYKVHYTEISGTVPISPTDVLHFKMDSILEDREHRFGSLEHKTHKKSFSESYFNQWPMSIQIGSYNHVLNCQYGVDNSFGVKINGAGFLMTKFDFKRIPFKQSKDQMQVWLDTVNYYIEDLKNETELLTQCSPNDRTLLAFPCRPTSCDKWFGCTYLDFCMSWPNPLARCDEVPMGFHVRFWDPREQPTTHKWELKGEAV